MLKVCLEKSKKRTLTIIVVSDAPWQIAPPLLARFPHMASPSAEDNNAGLLGIVNFTAWWWGGQQDVGEGRTFRPRHGHRPGTRRFALHQSAERTLGSGNLRLAVALPEGEDLNEWLAMKTVDLFNEVHLVHGMLSDFCTDHSCPVMNAGSLFEYKWADGRQYKTPTAMSAPKYCSTLLAWVQAQLDDERLFPTAPGAAFPPNFRRETVSNIFRRLFRVYGHIYHSHLERVVELTFEAHLNSCFKHLMYFVLTFDLVRTEELQPLQPLIAKLIAEDDLKWGKWSPPSPRPPPPMAAAAAAAAAVAAAEEEEAEAAAASAARMGVPTRRSCRGGRGRRSDRRAPHRRRAGAAQLGRVQHDRPRRRDDGDEHEPGRRRRRRGRLAGDGRRHGARTAHLERGRGGAEWDVDGARGGGGAHRVRVGSREVAQ